MMEHGGSVYAQAGVSEQLEMPLAMVSVTKAQVLKWFGGRVASCEPPASGCSLKDFLMCFNPTSSDFSAYCKEMRPARAASPSAVWIMEMRVPGLLRRVAADDGDGEWCSVAWQPRTASEWWRREEEEVVVASMVVVVSGISHRTEQRLLKPPQQAWGGRGPGGGREVWAVRLAEGAEEEGV